MQKNNFGTADALMKIFNFHRVESDLDCAVYYNGKRIYDISHRLVIQKGLTQEQVDVIKQLHVEKLDIFELMKSCTDIAQLRNYAELVTAVEFDLQDAWGFERNLAYHRFWELPKCACPKLDNYDASPHMSYMSGDCLIHGHDIS